MTDNFLRITINNKEMKINLQEKPFRNWDNKNTIKFYHRGVRSYPTFTKTGKFKKPRDETQLYINGKYFIQLSWNTTQQNEIVITKIITTMYMYGYELPEIKEALKKIFYN